VNILILSEHVEGKFGLYSGVKSVKLPDNTYWLPEDVLSNEDLESAKDLIISKQTISTELLEYKDTEYFEEGKVYRWLDYSLEDVEEIFSSESNFICRQSHLKTIYKPSEIPALFTFFRENSYDLLWIQNEYVYVGWKRVYNDVQYECLQEHMTVEGQTPDVLAGVLWIVVPVQTTEWTVGVQYNIGDIVTYQGNEYECIQAHTAIVGWYPNVVPALWRRI